MQKLFSKKSKKEEDKRKSNNSESCWQKNPKEKKRRLDGKKVDRNDKTYNLISVRISKIINN